MPARARVEPRTLSESTASNRRERPAPSRFAFRLPTGSDGLRPFAEREPRDREARAPLTELSDGVDVPGCGDPFQLMLAAVVELDA